MDTFTTLTSTALPVHTENIDTDQIIPAEFLKTTSRQGLGQYLFYRWRFNDDGTKIDTSVFWDTKHTGSSILLAGNNFGCGSSREHAVWALMDYGFRVIISSSFGDIFYNNALKNGLLPITLAADQLEHLFRLVHRNARHEITIDLENQKINVPSSELSYDFFIDQFRKVCLINGVDELGYILKQEQSITEYEKTHPDPHQL